jgi:O-6-methylguanine DNA methyltransferase
MVCEVHLDCVRIASPVGALTILESDRGIIAVEIGDASRSTLARRLSPTLRARVVIDSKAPGRSARQLGEYFARKRRRFDLDLDLRAATPFQRRVLEALWDVGYGQLVTYGDLAIAVRKPGASRAIGGAMAKDPIPIIVPCHRVVAADGSLGGFSSGLEVKRWLHRHEGVRELPGGWPPARANAALSSAVS